MNQSNQIVHLVDDDASFLTATGRLLRASGYTVKAFLSVSEFLAEVGEGTRGCVVADLHLPGASGLDLQAALAGRRDSMPVIFLTGQGDIPSSVQAMRGGAEDFLEKRTPKEPLLAAVTRALARDAAEHGERSRKRKLMELFESLSLREREVFSHVLEGKLNKQIASDLGIGERTVKAHRTAITTKLGLPSVAELARFAQEAGLIPNPTPGFPKGL